MTKQSDRWATPDNKYEEACELFQVVPSIDVCADADNTKCSIWFDEQMDALSLDWVEEAKKLGVPPIFWMNPPYSCPAKFIAKAWEQTLKGAIVLMYLPSDTSMAWYHDYIKPVRHEFLRGRVKFIPPPGITKTYPAKTGNIVAIFEGARILTNPKVGIANLYLVFSYARLIVEYGIYDGRMDTLCQAVLECLSEAGNDKAQCI